MINPHPSEVEQRRAERVRAQLTMLDTLVEILATEAELEPSAELSLAQPEGALEQLRRLLSRFHLVARQLRRRHSGRATLEVRDEYDVQDLLHALLRLHFEDIRPEEHTPSYAGGSARMDFLLKQEQVVVEIKHTRSGLSDREVGSQLIEDIARYSAHQDCRVLICFVYDPEGHITNPAALERDLSRDTGHLRVEVLVFPRGA